jgi:hypothetical protein
MAYEKLGLGMKYRNLMEIRQAPWILSGVPMGRPPGQIPGRNDDTHGRSKCLLCLRMAYSRTEDFTNLVLGSCVPEPDVLDVSI